MLVNVFQSSMKVGSYCLLVRKFRLLEQKLMLKVFVFVLNSCIVFLSSSKLGRIPLVKSLPLS